MKHLILLLLYLLYLNSLCVTREGFGDRGENPHDCPTINISKMDDNTLTDIGSCIDNGLWEVENNIIEEIEEKVEAFGSTIIRELKELVKKLKKGIITAVDAFVNMFWKLWESILNGIIKFE